jgi:apolipoprotein N-acyltransferase
MTTFGVTLQNMTTVAASILVPIVIYFHEWQRNIVLGLSVVTLFVILLAYFAGRLVNDLVNMMEYRLENSSEV